MRKLVIILAVFTLLGCANNQENRKEKKPANFTIPTSPFDLDKATSPFVWGETPSQAQKKYPALELYKDNEASLITNGMLFAIYNYDDYDISIGIFCAFDPVKGLYKVRHIIDFLPNDNISDANLQVTNNHFDIVHNYYFNQARNSLEIKYERKTEELWLFGRSVTTWSVGSFSACTIDYKADKSNLNVTWLNPKLYNQPEILYETSLHINY